ncbi:MAG: hypothetical protein M3076_00970 [Actinomycetota bacterium]|nr:hypothetical protein [Actinomycetota bacterium]
MPAPTYLDRLRLEGAVLTACGALGTVVLLTATAQATRRPASTAAQLIVVAALLLSLGPRSVRRSIADSRAHAADEIGSGEPTPLWHIAAIVIALTLLAGELGGWDAGLRVTIGCMLVGAFQALVLSRIVISGERGTGRRYYRVAGSRILTGTRLGHTERDADSATQPQA